MNPNETLTKKHKPWRFILFLWILLILIGYIFTLDYSKPKQQLTFGITFSHIYADYLGLDWKKIYLDILDNLQVKNLRIMSYWTEIEPSAGQFNFENTDWLINEAKKRNAKIILVVGQRQPRWPECHIPQWAQNITQAEYELALLNYIKNIVERYRNDTSILYWQVENEPLLAFFGKCPTPNRELLKKEIALVETLDPAHPTIITASGEFDNWREAARFTDIVGVSLYRVIAKKTLGNIYYPLPPAFYRWRADLNPKTENLFISELQAEPWTVREIKEVPHEIYEKQMNAKKFREHLNFAIATGFDTFYLWGVEWWYWLKEQKNMPEMLNEAKKVFIEYETT